MLRRLGFRFHPRVALRFAFALLLVTGAPAPSSAAVRPVLQDAPDAVFEQAVLAHRTGDYLAADALWRSLLDEPLPREERARVLYDLGNTAWRLGTERSRLEAVAWYTACLRLAPRHADAWRSLEFARSELGLEPADRGDLSATVERLLSALTPGESLRLALAGLLVLASALALEALRGGRRWRWLAGLAAVSFAVSTLPLIWNEWHAGGDPMMVVAKAGVTLRSEPKPELPALSRVEAGEVLERVDELPGWVRVEGPQGELGWLAATELLSLDPRARDAR